MRNSIDVFLYADVYDPDRSNKSGKHREYMKKNTIFFVSSVNIARAPIDKQNGFE